jgi:hypothetical protein
VIAIRHKAWLASRLAFLDAEYGGELPVGCAVIVETGREGLKDSRDPEGWATADLPVVNDARNVRR